MAWVPYAISAAGTLYKGIKGNQAAKYNARAQEQEGALASAESNVEEGQVRNRSAEDLARQLAAFGAAGTGYSGSAGTALRQSAVNQEMDALATRYKGALRTYGDNTQANLTRDEGRAELTSSILMAGGKAMSYMTGSYAGGGGSQLGKA